MHPFGLRQLLLSPLSLSVSLIHSLFSLCISPLSLLFLSFVQTFLHLWSLLSCASLLLIICFSSPPLQGAGISCNKLCLCTVPPVSAGSLLCLPHISHWDLNAFTSHCCEASRCMLFCVLCIFTDTHTQTHECLHCHIWGWVSLYEFQCNLMATGNSSWYDLHRNTDWPM